MDMIVGATSVALPVTTYHSIGD